MADIRKALCFSFFICGLAMGQSLDLQPEVAQPATQKSNWVVAKGKVFDDTLISELSIQYDLWLHERLNGKTTIALPLEALRKLQSMGIALSIDNELTTQYNAPPRMMRSSDRTIPSYPCYRTVEETHARMQALANTYPNLARLQDIGDSWDKVTAGGNPGYDILDLVIENQAVPGPKAPMILVAAMHAREYTTAETALRFAEQILTNYATDGDFRYLVDSSQIHIVPQFNPDGRKFAETGLFWRKNADNNFCPNSNNRGVDLNRNHSFRWGTADFSTVACADIFHGPNPASEPETQVIETLMSQVFTDQRGPLFTDAAPDTATGVLVSLHSYGNFVVYPWESTYSGPAPNREGFAKLGRKLGFYNTGYSVCQTCISPETGGTTVEKAYGEYGVAAFTYEIGNSFFESCSNYEAGIATQNLNSLKFALKAARRPYLEPTGPETINVSAVVSGSNVVLSARADDGRRVATQDNFNNNPVVVNSEPSNVIGSVRYSIDTPSWNGVTVAMTPSDGAFDTTAENATATIPIVSLTTGQHLIYVYSIDATGAAGVPTAVLVSVVNNELVFRDGFE